MAVTIRDVAREAGVSITTVSHALSGRRPVSSETRERVETAADRLGYRPNRLAVSMVTGVTRTIGVVVPDIANPFFSELVRSVESRAHRHGYVTIVCSSDRVATSEDYYLELLQDKRVDAVLFVGSDWDPSPRLAAASAAGMPIVVLDQGTKAQLQGASYLAVANKQGGGLAARHLIDLGHTEVAVIAGPSDNPTSRDRLSGFSNVMRSHGIRLDGSRVKHTQFDFASGYQEAVTLLSAESGLTALFCANDLIALGALKAAGEAHIVVPTELSIIGFDDIFVSELVHPPLTTIRQPIHLLGDAAVELAVQLIEQGTDMEPVSRQLPLDLVVRESTTHPPRQSAP